MLLSLLRHAELRVCAGGAVGHDCRPAGTSRRRRQRAKASRSTRRQSNGLPTRQAHTRNSACTRARKSTQSVTSLWPMKRLGRVWMTVLGPSRNISEMNTRGRAFSTKTRQVYAGYEICYSNLETPTLDCGASLWSRRRFPKHPEAPLKGVAKFVKKKIHPMTVWEAGDT